MTQPRHAQCVNQTDRVLMTEKGDPFLKREILTYLAGCPKSLLNEGNEALPELVLSLGKLLCWIAQNVDGPEPHNLQPLSETAVSVHALGKQFWELGIAFYDRRANKQIPDDVNAKLARMQDQLDRVSGLLARYDGTKEGVK